MKKKYEKPIVKMVALRTEERLASCDYFHYSSHGYEGCLTNNWELSSPATCKVIISEVSGS